MMQRRSQAQGGFSLIELLIVVAIILVISALAMPNFMTAIDSMKLRAAMSSYASFNRDLRMRAIRDNRTYWTMVDWQFDGSNWNANWYGDLNRNFQRDANEPFLPMPRNFFPQWGGGPSMASMNLNFPVNGWPPPAYNARGAPCRTDFAAACPTVDAGGSVGFVMTFWQARDWANGGWGAVTVHPGGRVKTWTWSGSSWQPN